MCLRRWRRFERYLIRERTLAGLKAARSRGRKGGRPRKLQAKENCQPLFKLQSLSPWAGHRPATRSAMATAASVSTQPGETRTTRIPCGVTSFDKLLLYVDRAAFAAAEAGVESRSGRS